MTGGTVGAGGSIRYFAAMTTVASGVIAAIGIAFLIAMFTSFAIGANGPAMIFGRINDTCVLLAYLLCAPSVIAIWERLRGDRPILNDLIALLGVVAIAAIVVLQALLVFEFLTFEEQIGSASIALFALGVWFVVAGYRGSSIGGLPKGARMGLLAATYLGYPIWAFWLARRLRSGEEAVSTSLGSDQLATTTDR